MQNKQIFRQPFHLETIINQIVCSLKALAARRPLRSQLRIHSRLHVYAKKHLQWTLIAFGSAFVLLINALRLFRTHCPPVFGRPLGLLRHFCEDNPVIGREIL